MLPNYSIIKLFKPKYNQEHINTEDITPRLIIIKCIPKTQQYIARYPNGHTERINDDWIQSKPRYEPGYPGYISIAKETAAFALEFRKNEPIRTYMHNVHPDFAQELEQAIEAKHQAMLEQSKTPPVTIADLVPRVSALPIAPGTPEPPIVVYNDNNTDLLRSIDRGIQTLIDLWGGKR